MLGHCVFCYISPCLPVGTCDIKCISFWKIRIKFTSCQARCDSCVSNEIQMCFSFFFQKALPLWLVHLGLCGCKMWLAGIRCCGTVVVAYHRSLPCFFCVCSLPSLMIVLFSSRKGKTFVAHNRHTKKNGRGHYWAFNACKDQCDILQEKKKGRLKKKKKSERYPGCVYWSAECTCADSRCEYAPCAWQTWWSLSLWLLPISPVCVLLTLFLGYSKTGYVSEQKTKCTSSGLVLVKKVKDYQKLLIVWHLLEATVLYTKSAVNLCLFFWLNSSCKTCVLRTRQENTV